MIDIKKEVNNFLQVKKKIYPEKTSCYDPETTSI